MVRCYWGEKMPTLQEWLEDPSAIRGIFVIAKRRNVVGATEEDIYLSSVGYLLSDSLVSFDPVINNSIRFTESLSLNGGASMSYGDIEINNFNGELDNWLDSSQYIWVNRSVQIYVGDPSWTANNISDFITSKFFLVFDGIIANIDSRKRETLNIVLRDKLERLNTPININTLGNYGTWQGPEPYPNKDQLKPLVFGEVHNIEPTLIDPSQYEYIVNNGDTEQIIEIRDNGVPVYTSGATGVIGAVELLGGAVLNLTNGTFELTESPYGTITTSVQGIKKRINLTTGALENVYENNIAKIVALIVTQYGDASYKLTASELDLPNFTTFSNNTQPVGIYIPDRENVINVCQALVESIGGQLFMNRLGKLQILRLFEYTSDPVVTITDADILHHSLSISERTEVLSAVSINCVKNWTVQTGVLTDIPINHKALFEESYTTSTSEDSTTTTLYRLNGKPEPKESLLIRKADADAETARLVNHFKVPKTVYKFIGTSKLMSIKLGQQVTLTHNRFNLQAGKTGQVISISPDLLNAKIEIEVII